MNFQKTAFCFSLNEEHFHISLHIHPWSFKSSRYSQVGSGHLTSEIPQRNVMTLWTSLFTETLFCNAVFEICQYRTACACEANVWAYCCLNIYHFILRKVLFILLLMSYTHGSHYDVKSWMWSISTTRLPTRGPYSKRSRRDTE
jgi:hypothetical protein